MKKHTVRLEKNIYISACCISMPQNIVNVYTVHPYYWTSFAACLGIHHYKQRALNNLFGGKQIKRFGQHYAGKTIKSSQP